MFKFLKDKIKKAVNKISEDVEEEGTKEEKPAEVVEEQEKSFFSRIKDKFSKSENVEETKEKEEEESVEEKREESVEQEEKEEEPKVEEEKTLEEEKHVQEATEKEPEKEAETKKETIELEKAIEKPVVKPETVEPVEEKPKEIVREEKEIVEKVISEKVKEAKPEKPLIEEPVISKPISESKPAETIPKVEETKIEELKQKNEIQEDKSEIVEERKETKPVEKVEETKPTEQKPIEKEEIEKKIEKPKEKKSLFSRFLKKKPEPKKEEEKKPEPEIKKVAEEKDLEEKKPETKSEIVSKPVVSEVKEVKKEKPKTEIKEPETIEPEKKKGLFASIKEKIVTTKINADQFDTMFWELELGLMENNVAVEVIEKIKTDLKNELVDNPIRRGKVQDVILTTLKGSIVDLFEQSDFNLLSEIKNKSEKPYVIAFVGINGSGKTTSIAKFTNMLKDKGLNVVLAAADTFRAASIEQLQLHADKIGVKIIKHDYGSDPAAVAFDAIKHAKAKEADVVLIDTAGRMHSNENLIAEMEKIIRVAKPDLKIFVGESITGNDCVEQAKTFNDAVGIDGIILSKADIDEKGGAAVSVSYVTKKPILYLGTGQEYKDIEEFSKQKIIENIGLA